MRAKLVRALVALCLLPLSAFGAQIIVVNGDPPGQGFNDPTPAAPIGGNPGTTVGQQALNVFQRAADTWGAKLQTSQPVLVIAFFLPLPCNATSAVLGAADAEWYFANVPGAKGGKALAANTWYQAALAEKITAQNIVADPNDPFEMFAFFNSNLGQTGCLTGNGWYYGVDNKEPANRVDLLAVVLHEFGHGLGFSVGTTDADTGARFNAWPSIWESFMLDMTSGKRWIDMTDGERAASARNNWNLVWAGQHGSNNVKSVLDFRTEVTVDNPASLGVNEAQSALFGPALKNKGVSGALVGPSDGGGVSPLDGCEPFAANSLAGKIALINRGNCVFAQKVKNAQNAGATAVIIANNAPQGFPSMAGVDPTITIPSVGVTQALGAALRTALPSVFVEIGTNPKIRAGTTANYPRLYAPSAFAPGSSVSHFDVTLTKNVLMEPFINTDLTSSVKNPEDLTRGVFMDIGW